MENGLVAVSSTRAVRIRVVRGSRRCSYLSDNSPSRVLAMASTSEVQTPSSSGIAIQLGGPGTFPHTLCLSTLMCTMDGHILWVLVPKLASLELMFRIVSRCDLTYDHVEDKMQKRDVPLPETVLQLDLFTFSALGMM